MSARIKRGDTLPPLTLTLTDAGAPVDLTTASRVRLIARAAGDRGTGPAYIDVDLPDRPDDGVITYPLRAADSATAGSYRVEVEITWPGAAVQTFPGDGYAELLVLPDLA